MLGLFRVGKLDPYATQTKYAACPALSPSFALDDASTQAKCEYIMNHPIDTDSPVFSFLPKFGQVVQDLWVEEIIPLLLDHPSALSVDDNAA